MPADRVGVVPNAIDPERFRPLPDAGAAHRRRLGIPEDAFLIGCLTRFNVRKRNEVAIDAAVRLAAQPGRAVHLLMIGEGDTEADLRTRAAPLGDAAHFVPTTGAEPAELLSGCDVVVFCPSPTEGEPLAISMGMLTERPVVATGAEGATGLIQPGTGAIAKPDHDPVAVAVLLAGYRADPALVRTEGRAARELAARRHDPGAVAERAEALLFGGARRAARPAGASPPAAGHSAHERGEAGIDPGERADGLHDREREQPAEDRQPRGGLERVGAAPPDLPAHRQQRAHQGQVGDQAEDAQLHPPPERDHVRVAAPVLVLDAERVRSPPTGRRGRVR